MNHRQNQELVVFSDHSVVSPAIWRGNERQLMTVTYQAATSPTWLLNKLAQSVLSGPEGSHRRLFVGSFAHDAAFLQSQLANSKIPMEQCIANDFLTDFVLKNVSLPKEKVLASVLGKFPATPNNSSNDVIILQQPELLISLLDGLTGDELHHQLIAPLLKRCKLLIIATSIEPFQTELADPLTQLTRFTHGLFHQSLTVLNLSPLNTGHATDITGTLRITRGGAHNPYAPLQIAENQYFYLVVKESVRLFYR